MDLELYRINAQLYKENEALKMSVEALASENARLRGMLERLAAYVERGTGELGAYKIYRSPLHEFYISIGVARQGDDAEIFDVIADICELTRGEAD